MKPDYSLIADVAEYAAMCGMSFDSAWWNYENAGIAHIRRTITGGAK